MTTPHHTHSQPPADHSGDHDHSHPHAGRDHSHNTDAAHQHADGGLHEHRVGHRHGDGSHHDHEHPGGLKGLVLSVLKPHSHDSADSVDSALEASAHGIRAVKISLVALGVTALLQVLIVAISGSVALLADTIHNFSDALTAVPLWIAFVLSRRMPSRRYTYGLGRAEDLAGLFIVGMIALSAVVAAWEAINRLINPSPVTNLGWVAVAGVIGFAGNELVALYRIRIGRQIGSAALVADGLHARTDGLTSLAVVLGAAGVALGWQAADPIIGLLITVAILALLRTAARDVFRRLLDGVDPAVVDVTEKTLLETPGVLGVREVQLRWSGHTLLAEADIEVDPALTVAQAHDIAHHAQRHLVSGVRRLGSATIHISPAGAHPALAATATDPATLAQTRERELR
jgi:cation diffusion facilitator family transporter